jgi:hypothetical protein
MFSDINGLKDASYMPLWSFLEIICLKIALRVIYFKLVKCYITIRIHYSVFRIMLRPEIVRMPYLALTASKQ